MPFQKRYLLSHGYGTVDERDVKESGDATYKVRQRIAVSAVDDDDIVTLISK